MSATVRSTATAGSSRPAQCVRRGGLSAGLAMPRSKTMVCSGRQARADMAVCTFAPASATLHHDAVLPSLLGQAASAGSGGVLEVVGCRDDLSDVEDRGRGGCARSRRARPIRDSMPGIEREGPGLDSSTFSNHERRCRRCRPRSQRSSRLRRGCRNAGAFPSLACQCRPTGGGGDEQKSRHARPRGDGYGTGFPIR